MDSVHFFINILLCFFSALGLLFIIEKFGKSKFIIDTPSERKSHTIPVPRIGGLVFYFTPLAFFYLLRIEIPVTLFIGITVIYIGGLWDDLYSFKSAKSKLVFQMAAALIFVYQYDISALEASSFQIIALKVLAFCFIIFLTNSMNLMDNMNGLTSGTTLIIFFILSLLAFSLPEIHWLGYYLPLTSAAILAFYYRNFPKGKIFMGDQGSQLLGYLSAISFLTITPQYINKPLSFSAMATFVAGIILFLPFIYDTLSVIVIRYREGRPITQGDLSHLSHRLVRRGLNPKTTAYVIKTLQLVCGLIFLAFIAAVKV